MPDADRTDKAAPAYGRLDAESDGVESDDEKAPADLDALLLESRENYDKGVSGGEQQRVLSDVESQPDDVAEVASEGRHESSEPGDRDATAAVGEQPDPQLRSSVKELAKLGLGPPELEDEAASVAEPDGDLRGGGGAARSTKALQDRQRPEQQQQKVRARPSYPGASASSSTSTTVDPLFFDAKKQVTIRRVPAAALPTASQMTRARQDMGFDKAAGAGPKAEKPRQAADQEAQEDSGVSFAYVLSMEQLLRVVEPVQITREELMLDGLSEAEARVRVHDLADHLLQNEGVELGADAVEELVRPSKNPSGKASVLTYDVERPSYVHDVLGCFKSRQDLLDFADYLDLRAWGTEGTRMTGKGADDEDSEFSPLPHPFTAFPTYQNGSCAGMVVGDAPDAPRRSQEQQRNGDQPQPISSQEAFVELDHRSGWLAGVPLQDLGGDPGTRDSGYLIKMCEWCPSSEAGGPDPGGAGAGMVVPEAERRKVALRADRVPVFS